MLVVIIRGPKAAEGVPSGPIGSHSPLPHSPACAPSVLLLLSMLAGHTMSSVSPPTCGLRKRALWPRKYRDIKYFLIPSKLFLGHSDAIASEWY